MKEKITNGFFGAVSWSVWAVMIFVIFFSFFLIITGMDREPVFTVKDAAVACVGEDDELLRERGKSGEDWYELKLSVKVSASPFSPYSYSADGFELIAPADFSENDGFFTVVDDPLNYSKASPGTCILSLYVNCPNGEDELLGRVSELGFGLKGLEGRLGFIKKSFKEKSPCFYLSDFPDLTVKTG